MRVVKPMNYILSDGSLKESSIRQNELQECKKTNNKSYPLTYTFTLKKEKLYLSHVKLPSQENFI